jgi:hypothetical protein
MINLLVAVILGGPGIYLLRRLLRLKKIGRLTKGKVVKFERAYRGTRFAVIRFNTSKGRFEISGGGIFSSYQLGDSVPILYNPKNPSEGMIYSSDRIWFLPLGLIGFSLYLICDLVVHTLGVVK